MTDVILYNFRINSKERLKRFSFHLASIGEFIKGKEHQTSILKCFSIRGRYKHESIRLIGIFCPNAIIRIGEENEPWKKSTYDFITSIFGTLHSIRRIAYFIEDWYFLGETQDQISQCIKESAEFSCCYTPVSIFKNGLIYEPWTSDEGIMLRTSHLKDINEEEFQHRSRLFRSGWDTWPVFCGGVYNPDFFEFLLRKPDVNHDQRTPFGMEYGPPLRTFDIKLGIIKKRLFVTFDDDQGHQGESMASRKLYPIKHSGAILRLREDLIGANNE